MKQLTYILIFAILFGCEPIGKPKKPDNLIPKDKMVNVIYDVYLLNAAKGIQKRKLEENSILPEAFVYEKHNIDSLQFAQSNEYYAYDTDDYLKIINKVKDKIETDKAKFEAINAKEEKQKERERDSIKRLLDSTRGNIKKIKIKPADRTLKQVKEIKE